MNSKYVIGFGILVAILIGVVAYVGITQNTTPTDDSQSNSSTINITSNLSDSDSSTDNTPSDNNTDNNNNLPVSETIRSSFQELIGLEQNYQCSFSNFQNGVSSAGTIYKSGNRIRAQYTDNNPNTNGQDINMIRGSERTYIWFASTGYVYQNPVIDNNTITSQDTDIEPLRTDTTIDFECFASEPSGTLYELPAGINFQEIKSNLDDVNNAINQTGLDTSVCDEIEDQNARNICLEALQAAQ